jgi:hypothetical protein
MYIMDLREQVQTHIVDYSQQQKGIWSHAFDFTVCCLLSVIEIGENHWKYFVPTHINRNLKLERFPLQKSSNFSPHILLFRVVAQVHNITCFFSLSGEPTQQTSTCSPFIIKFKFNKTNSAMEKIERNSVTLHYCKVSSNEKISKGSSPKI